MKNVYSDLVSCLGLLCSTNTSLRHTLKYVGVDVDNIEAGSFIIRFILMPFCILLDKLQTWQPVLDELCLVLADFVHNCRDVARRWCNDCHPARCGIGSVTDSVRVRALILADPCSDQSILLCPQVLHFTEAEQPKEGQCSAMQQMQQSSRLPGYLLKVLSN